MKSVAPNQNAVESAASNPVACLDPFRILKIDTCLSMSERSTLTYHVGCMRRNDSPDGDIVALYIRVYGNSAGGLFSNDWIALEVIQRQFDEAMGKLPITARLLDPLYRGKSANSPAFLFAVLKGAGLVRLVKDTKRLFERVDPGVFIAEAQALMASGVDLKVEDERERRQEKVTGKQKPVTPKPATKKAGKKEPQGGAQ